MPKALLHLQNAISAVFLCRVHCMQCCVIPLDKVFGELSEGLEVRVLSKNMLMRAVICNCNGDCTTPVFGANAAVCPNQTPLVMPQKVDHHGLAACSNLAS